MLNRHKTLAISLLESLGFLINYEKSNLTPSQQIVFLGMLVDSASMQFILPQQKAVQIQKECRLLLNTNRPTIRHLSRVLGLLEACRPAVWSAPLHYRQLQTLQINALQRWANYNAPVDLTPSAKSDLSWWVTTLQTPQGSPIVPPIADLTISSDASKQGWGGSLGFPTDRRSLERERVSRPHKCIRTPGSILCPEVLSPDPNQQSHLSETRQYHSSLVPKQLGGHSLPATSPSSNSDLGLVREETPISSGTAYPRQNQCGSGYRVPGETGSERLEDTTENNSTPYKGLHDRSLCLPPHTPTKTVCQLETGSERGAQRRLHDGLVESEGICLPSVQLNSVSSSEGQEGTRDSGASGTTMDHTTLVASTDRTYCGLPGISGEQPQTTAVSSPGAMHPLFPSLKLAVWRILGNVTK